MNALIYNDDVETFLWSKRKPRRLFDLVLTSPPYNIGKNYESAKTVDEYLAWQGRVIARCAELLKPTGSICWQVGNHVRGTGRSSTVLPLDLLLHQCFESVGLRLRNRIVWKFGHGLHCKHRFSGRHEVVLWYAKTDRYVFNLDPVRVPSKYPGKKHYKGAKAGALSGNPLGKNPEDVWDIPNVKNNHVEKTEHPCQFPVALAERLILALTNRGDLVFDPFAGVCSTGVAAVLHGRRFMGCEIDSQYCEIGQKRIEDVRRGRAKTRAMNKPVYMP